MTLSPSRNSPFPVSFSFFFASCGFRYFCRTSFNLSTPRSPLRIGVRTWISRDFAFTYGGSFFCTRYTIPATITSASYLFKKKKSLLLLSIFTVSPRLILWAFMTISLSVACRKILFSFTTLKHRESITSFKTLPGPTLGSWLTSPTRISLVPTCTARSSACIREISTIDISSIMITSASSGFSSFRSKCTAADESSIIPDSSRSRWIVDAW